MPISSYTVIPDIVNKIILKNPKTVLDVGIGNGMYGCLVRNYIEDAEIIGIEGFEPYNNALWEAYNDVYIGRAPDVFESLDASFDAIIMTDVIEHFHKDEGFKVIEELKKLLKPEGIILISTPTIFCKQGDVNGNKLEIHKSVWSPKDLKEFEPLRNQAPDKWGHYMEAYFYQSK